MWINGQPGQKISATDRGLLYGDGLFETVLINKTPVMLAAHIARLQSGCKRIGLEYPASLPAEIEHFLENQPSIGVLKILLTRGNGGRGYQPSGSNQPTRILQFHKLPENIGLNGKNGIRAVVCQHPISTNSHLAGLKHLNRLDQVLASMELGNEFNEGLMRTEDHLLIEGTRSNVFLVVNNKLLTPDLCTAGVAGVMRAYLLEQFAQQSSILEIRAISMTEVHNASEVFVCNSVFGIWPITQLQFEDRILAWPIGPVTRFAQQCLFEEFAI